MKNQRSVPLPRGSQEKHREAEPAECQRREPADRPPPLTGVASRDSQKGTRTPLIFSDGGAIPSAAARM